MEVHPSAHHLARRRERPMDGLVLVLFVLAAFAGGFVSGFSGFAMGLVVSGVWLHVITPVQTAALVTGRAARGVPAGAVRGVCSDLDFAWHHRSLHIRNPQIVWTRSAVPARRPLERLQAVRKD